MFASITVLNQRNRNTLYRLICSSGSIKQPFNLFNIFLLDCYQQGDIEYARNVSHGETVTPYDCQQYCGFNLFAQVSRC